MGRDRELEPKTLCRAHISGESPSCWVTAEEVPPPPRICTQLRQKIEFYILYMAQVIKKSTCNAGDLGSIPGSGRSPREGNGNPLQYSCLKNPMDREAWWATVHGVAKNRTQLKRLSPPTMYMSIPLSRFIPLPCNFLF